MKDGPHRFRLEFWKEGTNASGAAIGTLSLFDGPDLIKRSRVFSGGRDEQGNMHAPIGDGQYSVRLDIKGTARPADMYLDDNRVWQLEPYDGIQELPKSLDPGIDRAQGPRAEWGSIRAHLNQPKGEHRSDHTGNYLHGKELKKEWTHGCICEKEEAILHYLLELARQKTVSRVSIVVKTR